MKKGKEKELSFEYKPIETEMDDYNDSNNASNDKKRFAQMINEDDDDSIIENSDNKDNVYNDDESIQSLQSLRISRQSSGRRDNEKTLLERINIFHMKDNLLLIPHKIKNNNRILITDPFDVSNTNANNSNVMISQLDIHTNPTNSKLLLNQKENTESTLQHTITGDNKSNILKEGMKPTNCFRSSNQSDNKPFLIKSKTNCNRNKCNKNQNTSESIEKIKRETECLNKTISDIINKINQKHMGAVFKVKPVTLKGIRFKGNEVNKTVKHNNTTNTLKQYYQSSNNKTKINTIYNKILQSNLRKMINKESSLQKSHLICTKINPIISSKLISQTCKHSSVEPKVLLKHKENTKIESDHISFNYAIFHTIQSIHNNKVRNSLLNTISKKKISKPMYASKPLKLNKAKVMNTQSSLEFKGSILHNHIDNYNDKGTKMHYNHTFQFINKTMQLNTPINMKPHKNIYKSSNNKIPTTPLKNLKIKIKQNDTNNNIR